MPVQLTGLAGFDSSSVVSQLVNIAQQPLNALSTKKSLVDQATSTLTSFSTKLANLKSAATALSTPSGFSSMGATSSDAAVVPSVTGSAAASSYTLEVTQLARAQKSRSASQASASAALGQEGDLTFTLDGKTTTVSIVATDSLSDIATKIGKSGARLSAAVINAGGSYRLSVQGLDTGAANAFSIGESGSVSLGLASIEAAQDAKMTVDGLEITRPTNQVADAVPGVTLALTKTTTEPTTLTIKADSSALKAKIQSFISAYNDVVNTGHTLAGYGTTKASNSVLQADTAIRRSLDRLSSLASGVIAGASGTYRSMAAVGVSLSRDGLMTMDAAKLDAALDKDPESVRRLFVTDTESGATGVMKSIADMVTSLITTDGGPVKARIEALGNQSKRLVEEYNRKADRVDAYEKALKKQFANLDQAMSRYQSMAASMGSLTNSGNNNG